ncbi:acyl-CoA thioesterase [Sphingomonas profundi]|uniref:acyl-CoA thioesterase n=1 Tax=Alterirhizorhabdus profundi TaxID=2681549 RepID=UPI0018D10E78|nr:hypothetical protein [Sphingomonas profundi]
MIEAIDGIVSTAPFVARRQVAWADCDPAGVVFAGNYYLYALWTYDLYRARRLAIDHEMAPAPMKAASIVHHAPLYPGDMVDLAVRPIRISTSTFSLAIAAAKGGQPIFDAELTFICRAAEAWTSRPVPQALRDLLLADAQANGVDLRSPA